MGEKWVNLRDPKVLRNWSVYVHRRSGRENRRAGKYLWCACFVNTDSDPAEEERKAIVHIRQLAADDGLTLVHMRVDSKTVTAICTGKSKKARTKANRQAYRAKR